ncbi:MAG: MBL fold metallo-hydrolase [Lachnospiraceae bacterium]|jgi:L-ascorbate metabolism protein UlaG (beta-lactamase superfamily)|nr:MBL fold metallo-hydrolase [Lachnospiraceae bacterium]
MKITYIHHSAFLVETDTLTLLFDYYTGAIPAIGKDRPLYVLTSHAHPDHFDRSVFRLASEHPAVRFLLSADISRSAVPSSLLGQTVFLKPETVWSDSLLRVETLRSNDAGCAFWCTALQDGKAIYHAGDLNNWYWDGDRSDAILADKYHRELERLRGRRCDVAFIPVDPRLRAPQKGMLDFLGYCGADVLFPMHQWEKYGITAQVKALPEIAGCRDRIREISQDGQVFDI